MLCEDRKRGKRNLVVLLNLLAAVKINVAENLGHGGTGFEGEAGKLQIWELFS